MTATEPARETTGQPLVVYSPTDAAIAKMKSEFLPLLEDPNIAETAEGYREVTKAIGVVRPLRTGVEKRRLSLNEDARARIKFHDDEAKRITSLLRAIEDPLKAKKDAADEKREKVIREKAEAEKAALEAQQQAAREVEEARQKANRDAEDARLKAEREQITRDRAEILKQQAEAAERRRKDQEEEDRKRKIIDDGIKAEQERVAKEQRDAQEKIDAANRDIEAKQKEIRDKQDAIDREEFRKQALADAKAKADKEAADKVAREQAEAERIKAEEAAEAKRLADAKPDVEKVRAFGGAIRKLVAAAPRLSQDATVQFMAVALDELIATASRCENYTVAPKRKPARSKEMVA